MSYLNEMHGYVFYLEKQTELLALVPKTTER
jgi:hypothetical protein